MVAMVKIIAVTFFTVHSFFLFVLLLFNIREIEGGTTYGTLQNPTELGSGGGDDGSFQNKGGSGGGAIFISAQSLVLNLDSLISSNGQSGQNGTSNYTNGGGGGSGGSIILQTGEIIIIEGRVSAKGGDGGNRFYKFGQNTYAGGAGGGGRIFINSSIPLYYTADEIINAGGGKQWCSANIKTSGSVVSFCEEGMGSYYYGCEICRAGTFSNNGKCVSCPAGSFSNSSHATSASMLLSL